MLTSSVFTISDDSGFLAIINTDKYSSFVSEQWEFPQLINHFIDQMNKDQLIIWETGLESHWRIEFLNRPTSKKAFREFSKSIEVTNGKLYLANFEDLTMAAQFESAKLPVKHNVGLYINLENGTYNVTVRQLFDPETIDLDKAANETNFEVVINTNTLHQAQQVSKVFWWTH